MMSAPVESKPLCSCSECNAGRKLFGLVLAQCGLIPAKDADFMCRPLTEFMSRMQKALDRVLGETQATQGVDLRQCEGWRDVLYAALLVPALSKPGMMERILPLAEKLTALQEQAEGSKAAN